MLRKVAIAVVVLIIVAAGFVVGRQDNQEEISITPPAHTGTTTEQLGTDPKIPEEPEASVTPEAAPATATTVEKPDPGITVDTSQLTTNQKQLLETLGIDTNNITITPEMIACAEEKVGTDRLTEIQNGDTPSFTEGLTLLTCYQL